MFKSLICRIIFAVIFIEKDVEKQFLCRLINV
jgi:hypothetical protein